MLDDLKYIAQFDPADILGEAERQVSQLDWDCGVKPHEHPKIANIVLGGMGGSAFFTDILKVWPGLDVPFETVRHYNLPEYVGPNTLFIASSFSGNTEEALSMLEDAKRRKAIIVVMASGGKLEEIAKAEDLPFAKLDHNIPQPRMSVYCELICTLTIFKAYGLHEEDFIAQLKKLKPKLSAAAQQWRADVPTKDNLAKQLAEFIAGKSAVTYSGPILKPAAFKLKMTVNENAKNVAWNNTYPEFSHNEFIGWSVGPVEKPYAIINFLSDLEHPRIKKRFAISDRMLSGMRPEPRNVECQGETTIEQILWGMMLADFVGTYLAVLNKTNPKPVGLVEEFKVELNK